jgi:hypothetical protein
VFWAPRLAADSTADGDADARLDAGLAAGQGRGGGTRAVDTSTGESRCCVGGEIGGEGADDWARQGNCSSQGSIMMANAAVSLPNRSIGRVSLPGPW